MLRDHCKKEHGVVNSLQFVSYKCHICSKEIMTKKSAEIHALGECSFLTSFSINCELCKMTFSSTEAFKVHKATHFDVGDPEKRLA